jgi:tape measure domain-containing protein
LQAAGFSADTARKALMGFGNALATIGRGKEDLDGVIRALTQIASKGKISAEEINQLAERLPQIRVAMKNVFGTADTEVLQKMGIASKEFVELLIEEFNKAPKAMAGLKTELEILSEEMKFVMAEIGGAIAPISIQIASGFLESVKGMRDAMALVYLELDKAKDYAYKWLKEAGPLWQQVAGMVALMNNPLAMFGTSKQPEPKQPPPAPTATNSDTEKRLAELKKHAEAVKKVTNAYYEMGNVMIGPMTEAQQALADTNQLYRDVGAAIHDLEISDHQSKVKMAAKAWTEIVEAVKGGTYAVKEYRAAVISTPAFLPGGLDQALSGADQERMSQRATDGLKELGLQYKYVLKDAKDSWKGQSEVMREVSTVFTDMSRDIAKLIMDGGKLKDVFTNAMKSMAEAMIRLVIQGAFRRLGTVITKAIGDLSGLGKIFSSIFGSGAGGAASGAVGSVAGSAVGSAGSGAAGVAGSAVGAGITGIVGAVAGVVGAVSSVIGNFQMQGMNKSLDLIEHETRFSQIHLLNILEKINKHLPGIDDLNKRLNEAAVNGWKVWTEGAMVGAVAGGGGYTTTINFSGAWIGYRDVDTFVDDLVRRIKSKL